MTDAVWRGLAGVGVGVGVGVRQYVACDLTGKCSCISLASAHPHALVDNVSRSGSPGMLNNMSWREFETLVTEGFRLQGYSLAENFQPGPDEGIDVRLRV